jgi:hypothetical protein
MYSDDDTLAGGFPHSEICGSKVVCHLTAAYRRLLRPSSPVIAKASTTCTYSLDPIGLRTRRHGKTPSQGYKFCVNSPPLSLETVEIWSTQSHCRSWEGAACRLTIELLKSSRNIRSIRSNRKPPASIDVKRLAIADRTGCIATAAREDWWR